MLFHDPLQGDPKRAALRAAYRMEEGACVRALVEQARLAPAERAGAEQLAGELIAVVRARKVQGVEAFLQEYGLDTREGVVTLCVAESPEAGGPSTLYRYATERVSSINTTAAGGNASLFAASAEEDLQTGTR